ADLGPETLFLFVVVGVLPVRRVVGVVGVLRGVPGRTLRAVGIGIHSGPGFRRLLVVGGEFLGRPVQRGAVDLRSHDQLVDGVQYGVPVLGDSLRQLVPEAFALPTRERQFTLFQQ